MTNNEIIAKTKEEIRLRRLSEKTEKLYIQKIEFFIKHYQNRPLEGMSEVEIREFLIFVTEERKASSSTVNVYSCALRFVFGAILERNLIQFCSTMSTYIN